MGFKTQNTPYSYDGSPKTLPISSPIAASSSQGIATKVLQNIAESPLLMLSSNPSIFLTLGAAKMAAKGILGVKNAIEKAPIALKAARARANPKSRKIALDFTNHIKQQVGTQADAAITNLRLREMAINTLQALEGNLSPIELHILTVMEKVEGIAANTSGREIGETLDVVTDFLKRYHEVYTQLLDNEFASTSREEAAWETAMENFYHPALRTAPSDSDENPLVDFAHNFVERAKNVVVGELNVLPGFPIVQNLLLDRGMQIVNNEIENRINQQVEGRITPPIKDQKQQQAYAALQTKFTAFLGWMRAHGFQIETPEAGAITPNQQIVYEKIGGKQVVFFAADRARELGILPGMERALATRIWNRGKTEQEPLAHEISQLVNAVNGEGFNIQGHQPVSLMIKTVIKAVLSQPSRIFRDLLCRQIARIPYLGRILAPLLRAILWATDLTLKGMYHTANFFVGLPSAEVISDEISKNLLRHVYNPALMSAPILLIERVLSILDRPIPAADAEGMSTVQRPQAFIGELILEFSNMFKLLCPSLFQLRNPRFVKACARMALWTTRKSIGLIGIATVNPISRKITLFAVRIFSRNTNAEKNRLLVERSMIWIQGSMLTLLGNKSNLGATHSILSSGYKTLGEFGIVSEEQSHFENGNISWAHLIHNTALAASRFFLTPSNFQAKMRCDLLRAKLDKGIAATPEDLQPLQAVLMPDFNRTMELRLVAEQNLQTVQGIPTIDYSSLLDNQYNLCERLNLPENWNGIAGVINALNEAQIEKTGVPVAELVQIQKAITDTQEEFAALSRVALKYATSNTDKQAWVELYARVKPLVRRHNKLKEELVHCFGKTHADLTAKRDTYINLIAGDQQPATTRVLIEEYLKVLNIASYSGSHEATENELKTRLTNIDTQLAETIRSWQFELLKARGSHSVRGRLQERIENSVNENQGRLEAIQLEAHEQGFFGGISRFTPIPEKVPTVEQLMAGDDVQFIEAVDLYVPEVFAAVRKEYFELITQKYQTQQQLSELYDRTHSRPLFQDPVWILEQKGDKFLELARRLA